MSIEKHQSLHSYNALINHAIEAAAQQGRGSIAGFYLVSGPTGSGKTSALYRAGYQDNAPAVLEFLRQQQQGKFPAILVTHRWNILQEVYQEVVKRKDSKQQVYKASLVYGQETTITAAVAQEALPHETSINSQEMPSFEQALEQFDAWQLFAQPQDKAYLRRNCHNVCNLARDLTRHKSASFNKFLHQAEEELSRLCSLIENSLLKIMARLEQEVTQLDKEGASSLAIEAAQKKLADFRVHPWIRRIFPAIAWRDEQQDLLIMTSHKLLYSFYDGQQKTRLSSPHLAGYVIFIDEFDYQADILQSLLTQSQKIQELPICIALLLEKGQELVERIQYDSRTDIQNICMLLKNLLADLNQDLAAKNIDLSAVNNLVTPLEDFKAGHKFETQYLFRADHLATSKALFLRKTKQGFAVMQGKANEQGDIDVGQFLRLMEKYLRRYVTLFSQASWLNSNAIEYLRELNSQLFDPTNDYQTSYYSRALLEIMPFALHRADVPELKTLARNNLLPHTQANLHGFTSWLLKSNKNAATIDKQRLEVQRAFMPTTAEGLMLALASRNLVFGLSATAYIERAISHFDLRWIRAALKYIAEARQANFSESFLGNSLQERKEDWLENPIPYLATHVDLQQQQSVIKSITLAKAELRQTKLLVEEKSFFIESNCNDLYYTELIDSLPNNFFSNADIYEADSTIKYRQSLLIALLRVINLAGQNKLHQGHLVFVNSSRHLRQAMKQHKNLLVDLIPWFSDEPDFYNNLDKSHLLQDFSGVFIPVQLNKEPAFICFLTADNQKKLKFAQAYQAAFATGRQVIVIAQAASATNGINLDFTLPETGLTRDLTCLYLLEGHHYYFSANNGQLDAMAHAGMQLRNLDKLRRFSQISRAEQRFYLSPLMNQEVWASIELNRLYKQTEDYIKNLAADVQQQVGRIERAWAVTPEVKIYLEPTLANSLRKFSALPAYQNNKYLVSELNQRLLTELNAADNNEDWLEFLNTPAQTDKNAKYWIDNKLKEGIAKSRKDKQFFKFFCRLWQELGRAALQYDLQWQPKIETDYLPAEPLKNWASIKRPYQSGTKKIENQLWYNPTSWQFFASRKAGCKLFDLEKFYRPVQRNPDISNWFSQEDFRKSLKPANDVEEAFMLHPSIVQRILQGRLGEEAIRALFKSEGIATCNKYPTHQVFEVYDFSLKDRPFKVDAKYWSTSTLNKADTLFIESANKSPVFTKAVEALIKIRTYEGQQMRLLILNLVATASATGFQSYTLAGVPTQPEKADLIFLEGCIHSFDLDFTLTEGFKKLVNLINEVEVNE